MARDESRSEALRTFGLRLRRARTAKKLSQEALGHEAGLHPTYISSVERGERNISLINILRLAQALKIDAGKLVSRLKA